MSSYQRGSQPHGLKEQSWALETQSACLIVYPSQCSAWPQWGGDSQLELCSCIAARLQVVCVWRVGMGGREEDE